MTNISDEPNPPIKIGRIATIGIVRRKLRVARLCNSTDLSSPSTAPITKAIEIPHIKAVKVSASVTSVVCQKAPLVASVPKVLSSVEKWGKYFELAIKDAISQAATTNVIVSSLWKYLLFVTQLLQGACPATYLKSIA